MHSPMKFAAISTATGHLQGRIIGFVRDRTAAREPPTPILLPQRKTWELVKETVNTDGPSLLKYCADNPTRIGTLWKGEGGDENAQEELQAPRLIAIPLWLLDRIRQEGRALMPTSRPTIQRRMQMHGLQLPTGASWRVRAPRLGRASCLLPLKPLWRSRTNIWESGSSNGSARQWGHAHRGVNLQPWHRGGGQQGP